MRRTAFTLIELLVVIAIIAILAAILFPVFAQAKESAKKAQSIMYYKQFAQSAVMYATDVDDLMPFGLTPNIAANSFRRTGGHAIPDGWLVTARYIPAEDAMGWANSTQPYRKNYQMLYLGTGPKNRVSGLDPYYAAPLKAWEVNHVAFNGLLQSYNLTSVASPSKLTMFWQGWGKTNDEGIAYINPRLNCRGTGPCAFNPSGYPQPDMSDPSSRGDEWNSDATLWVHAKGAVFVMTDTSTKWRPLGHNAGSGIPSGDGTRDPFSLYDIAGIPQLAPRCAIPGASVFYLCFFRPDAENLQ